MRNSAHVMPHSCLKSCVHLRRTKSCTANASGYFFRVTRRCVRDRIRHWESTIRHRDNSSTDWPTDCRVPRHRTVGPAVDRRTAARMQCMRRRRRPIIGRRQLPSTDAVRCPGARWSWNTVRRHYGDQLRRQEYSTIRGPACAIMVTARSGEMSWNWDVTLLRPRTKTEVPRVSITVLHYSIRRRGGIMESYHIIS